MTGWRPNPESWRYQERAESLPRHVERSAADAGTYLKDNSESYDDLVMRLNSDEHIFRSPGAIMDRLKHLKRLTRSFDDLKVLDWQHGDQPPSYAASVATEIESVKDPLDVKLPDTDLCQRCAGITIESLRAENGYRHSSLLAMSESAGTCKLCQVVLDTHGLKKSSWKLDCFKVILHLDPASPDYHGQHRDHYDSSDAKPPSATRIWIETVNTEPHLGDPMYAGGSKLGRIDLSHCRQMEDGSLEHVVRGRPLECFTEESDPAIESGIHWIRRLGQNTSSEASFNVARGWLNQCISRERLPWEYKHVLSGRTEGSVPPVDVDHVWTADEAGTPEELSADMPARLVDVMPDDTRPGKAHLMETNGRCLQYATLSYCWGPVKSASWLTTRDNFQAQLNGIERSDLPATLQDSLVILEKLHIRYIWIDALCIIQNDTTDWITEAAKMAGIYRGSLLTIAAASSPSTYSGCFNVKSTSHLERFSDLICVESTLSDGRPSRLYFYEHSRPGPYANDVLSGPLSTRAWTYQEQVLSRRMLYYTTSQLIWSCEHCLLAEDNLMEDCEPLYPVLAMRSPLTGESLLDLWYMGVVEEFARRNITYTSDRMVAISALAKATQLNKHVDYVAGLWKDSIVTGLMWMRDGPEVNVEVDRRNAFADVKTGYLKLDTMVTIGWVLKDHFRSYPPGSNEPDQTLLVSLPDTLPIWRATAHMDDLSASIQQVTCAWIGYNYENLLLLLLQPPDLNATSYIRNGIAVIKSHDSNNPTGIRTEDIARKMIKRTITIL
ncbi:hypothetical protein LTR66_011120 [Elasticomyces elasticus]|nr:hypothetical protein LTR66_011120 [Elasticomyces elasticus]